MGAIIYTRFSPRRNADKCESCEVQEAVCEEYAARNHLEIIARFRDEAVSGNTEIDDRNLRAAVNALKKGDILLVMKRDRLARDLLIGLQVERAVESRKASVVCCQGETFGNDPNAVLMKQMLMAIAEWERKIIGDRTRTAMNQHRRNGRRVSSKTPYGWKENPDDPKHLLPCEEELETLNEIWRLHGEGKNNHEIARLLDPKRARCGKWHPEVIRHLVRRLEIDHAV